MIKEKVSIVVPVYNVEAYLRKCLDSLLAQDYENMDVLVVNDGSPDNSQQIIDEYVVRYPQKIRSIIKENGGYGSSLEVAFQASDAEMILVCDPDDYLSPRALSSLVAEKKKTGAEMVVSAKNLVFSDDGQEKYDPSYPSELSYAFQGGLVEKSSKEFDAFYFVEPSPHGKLYPRELVASIVFPHKVSYTDNLLYFYCLSRISKIAYLSEAHAYYLINREGNTRTDKKPSIIDAWVKVFQAIFAQTPAQEEMLWYRLYEGFFSIFYKVEDLSCDNNIKQEKYHLLGELLDFYRPHQESIINKMEQFSFMEAPKVVAHKKALLKNPSLYSKMVYQRIHGSFKQKIKNLVLKNPLLQKVYEKYHFHAKYFYARKQPKIICHPQVSIRQCAEGVHFFGYYVRPAVAYGHTLWHQVPSTSLSLKQEVAIMVDGEKVSSSNTWNWQQGSMASFFDEKHIIHNFFDGKAYRSKKVNIETKEEVVYDFPVYSVACVNNFALSVNFSRLAKLRPDYGYVNLPYQTLTTEEEDGIYYIDLQKNKVSLWLSLKEIHQFETSESMQGAIHKVNHIDISPKEDKAIFLHRWYQKEKKYTRLLLVDIASKTLKVLADNGMVSHMAWVNEDTIFGYYCRQDKKDGYAFLNIHSLQEKRIDDPLLIDDGHPTVYNERYIVVDTYPDYRCLSHLYLLDTKKNSVQKIASFYSGKAFQGEKRCDLHPRFDKEGTSLTIDSVADHNERHVYHIDIHQLMEDA